MSKFQPRSSVAHFQRQMHFWARTSGRV